MQEIRAAGPQKVRAPSHRAEPSAAPGERDHLGTGVFDRAPPNIVALVQERHVEVDAAEYIVRCECSKRPLGAAGDALLSDVALEVAIAYPDETAGQVADRMAQGRFSRVPVIGREDRKLVGIVTRHELLRVRTLALQAEEERQGAVRLSGWGCLSNA